MELSELLQLLNEQIEIAKDELSHNEDKEGAGKLSKGLDQIYAEFVAKGSFEKEGTDSELRASFVTMQGLIELSAIKALETNKTSAATCTMVTPKLSTPLTLDSGKELNEIKFNDPKEFAFYRHNILLKFLDKGVIKSIYQNENAATPSAKFKFFTTTLHNSPFLTSPAKDKTGAIYEMDGFDIAVQSLQVGQPEGAEAVSKWSILLGEKAKSRVDDVNNFIKDEWKRFSSR